MILHVDMDAFYASVEERDRPELVGKPVIVGGTPEGRGVVAAANYVARKFGVHSAMPAVTAHRLCPRGIFLRPRMEYYADISDQIRAIFEKLGIHRIGQLRHMPVELLRHHFGSSGDHLWELSQGIDDRPVVPEQEAKSISHQTTFAKDLEDPEVMRAWLLELSEQVGCRPSCLSITADPGSP